MLETNVNYVPWAIIKLIFFVIFFVLLTFLIQIYSLRDMYDKDFEKHRYSIQLMPFVSWIRPDVTPASNFQYCTNHIVSPLMEDQAKVLVEPIQQLGKVVEENSKNVSELKEKTNNLQQNAETNMKLVEAMYMRSQALSHYIGIKVQNFFYKIGAAIISYYYLLIASINTFFVMLASLYRLIVVTGATSIVHAHIYTTACAMSPPTCMAAIPFAISSKLLAASSATLGSFDAYATKRAYCCFTPDSILVNGKEMKEHQLGDFINTNSKIIGIVVSESHNTPLYKLSKKVWVTGNHIVRHKNKWMCAKDMTKLSHKKTKRLMCFVTSNHRIETQHHTCLDYSETNDSSFIAQKTMEDLNPNFRGIQSIYEHGDVGNFLTKGTFVCVLNNMQQKFKRIERVHIGSYIKDNNGRWTRVIGVYRSKIPKHFPLVTIHGTPMSAQLIAWTTRGWEKIYNTPYMNKPFQSTHEKKGFHIVTTSGSFIIWTHNQQQKMCIRDFLENVNTYDTIEKHVKKTC